MTPIKTQRYKVRGTRQQFTAKVMAKKSNAVRFKQRQQQKILAERAAQATGAYGGLGGRGLDFGEGQKSSAKDVQESFSGAAIKYAPVVEADDDDEMLVGEDMEKEVADAIVQLEDGDDMAAFPIPE